MLHTKFTENSFVGIDLTECNSAIINDLLKVVNGKTLSCQIADAMELKVKGLFNDAMLAMTEINRDHVQAIRDVQKIIDKVEGKDRTEVILDKYRQTFPFQVGLVNGEDVILLLKEIQAKASLETEGIHKNEKELIPLLEELNFYETRMAGRVDASEVENLRETVRSIEASLISAKETVINTIRAFVNDVFQGIEIETKMTLIKKLYLIQTSSIQTLPSGEVEVI